MGVPRFQTGAAGRSPDSYSSGIGTAPWFFDDLRKAIVPPGDAAFLMRLPGTGLHSTLNRRLDVLTVKAMRHLREGQHFVLWPGGLALEVRTARSSFADQQPAPRVRYGTLLRRQALGARCVCRVCRPSVSA